MLTLNIFQWKKYEAINNIVSSLLYITDVRKKEKDGKNWQEQTHIIAWLVNNVLVWIRTIKKGKEKLYWSNFLKKKKKIRLGYNIRSLYTTPNTKNIMAQNYKLKTDNCSMIYNIYHIIDLCNESNMKGHKQIQGTS